DLQAAHAAAPWLVVWDDHETENNWADEVPEQPDPGFLDRRAAAFQAYYENMPLRSTARPRGIDMRLYRRFAWGELATFHMLDTRQYRDDQACGDGTRVNCVERLDPNRTITGVEQERWLLDGFHRSRARWDVLGQQVFFAQRDTDGSTSTCDVSTDAWDGYRASRQRITQGWVDRQVRNPVVLTGDVHRHWANNLRLNYFNHTSPIVGTELVTTSISSGGNGSGSTTIPDVATNPHLKFYSDRRGYVRTTISPTQIRADFRTVASVTEHGAPASTLKSFVIQEGLPGLQAA
ncbi:MAG TPA: alkaline phosphatase, partial [Micromonosporaceae bacterium]|nr:alkaline phosphatase [Micromonosporaceae bacterium]